MYVCGGGEGVLFSVFPVYEHVQNISTRPKYVSLSHNKYSNLTNPILYTIKYNVTDYKAFLIIQLSLFFNNPINWKILITKTESCTLHK